MTRRVSLNLATTFVIILAGVAMDACGANTQHDGTADSSSSAQQKEVPKLLQEMDSILQRYGTPPVPLDQRPAVMDAMRKLPEQALSTLAFSTEQTLRRCYDCSTYLTTYDVGETRLALSHKLTVGCLPYLDAVTPHFAAGIVGQMSANYDLRGQRLTSQSVQAYRNVFVRYRLRVWERVISCIDPTWRPGDPAMTVLPPLDKYSPGTPPERIREPDIRRKYQADLDANRQKAERNLEQRHARLLQRQYLLSLKPAIARIYRIKPVSADDWDVLKAHLRIYVSDEQLRKELFEIAQSAANGTDR